jgi:hypothetical protein
LTKRGNWGAFLTSPMAPRGEICSLGVNTLYCLEESPWDSFTPRGQNSPMGTTSPLGIKVCPYIGAKSRMGLCDQHLTLVRLWCLTTIFLQMPFVRPWL